MDYLPAHVPTLEVSLPGGPVTVHQGASERRTGLYIPNMQMSSIGLLTARVLIEAAARYLQRSEELVDVGKDQKGKVVMAPGDGQTR